MNYIGTLAVLSNLSRVLDTNVRLNNEVQMPVLGFGTYTITGQELIHKVVDTALKAGYRSFDTAAVYNNEHDIGLALKDLLPKYNLKREDIFITSKLAPSDQGKDKVRNAIDKSLKDLDLDYLDLYLIHWPGASGIPANSTENAKLRRESWEGMVAAAKEGKLKAIGVSNYAAKHLAELREQSPNFPPAVNQIEYHPHFEHPKELYDECAKTGILLQAYSSLGGNHQKAPLVKDPVVIGIADKINRTPAQVLLRWGLQRGYGIIPKSATPERIVSNAQLDFELSREDMDKLNAIPKREKYAWDPETIA